ncbi:Flavonoid 4'-O-methyltransferase [Spatholobus suberectus]|nr:Flavonoid 4'-O-methyltransferase [Spatholobus suberectus]
MMRRLQSKAKYARAHGGQRRRGYIARKKRSRRTVLTADKEVYNGRERLSDELGRGYWDFIHQNATHLKTFNEAMESDYHVWVLHNWSDDDCIKILKNCKDAISGKGKGGKVIIIDIVINEKQDEHEMTEGKLLLDIAMMTSLNGKERDEKEWKQLFMKAGFKHYKILPYAHIRF